jgi:hypothetical protein
MKKHLKIVMLLSFVILTTTNLSSQTYTIISRNNQDTILLFPNNAGAALKSLSSSLPGAQKETEPLKFLIKKVENGRESLIFVDFINTLDKYFVTYETDLNLPGKWKYTLYGFKDIYKSLTRRNAIYLEGDILGISFKIHQRPELYRDRMLIDNQTLISCPIKIDQLEKTLTNELFQQQKEEAENLSNLLLNLGISEDVAKDAIRNPDPYFIAYLLKSGNLNPTYRDEVRTREDRDKINQLTNEFSMNQLQVMGKGCNKEVRKYELRSY